MWNNWRENRLVQIEKRNLKVLSKRIIIAGGGTGGHIFPAIAIANALKKKDASIDILFVGAKGKMEMEKVPQAGYQITGLDIAGFNRSSLIKNIGLPFKLIKSFFQVRKIVSGFKPDAVIGVGGYSSFPVLRYAQAKGIPTFIHESNSFAGKSNILLGRKAQKVFVATEGMEKFFRKDKLMITGNPVRSSIVNNVVTREDGIEFFQLDPYKKTVLVTGGSLGAKGINEAIDAQLGEFEKHGVQLIWQTGKPYMQRAKEAAAGKKNVWTSDFITQMENAYAAADLVISRSGAMAIAELSVLRKPVIFVPFPFAAEDHQTVNAKFLESRRAGIMISDSQAKVKLVPAAIELAKDDQRRRSLSEEIGKLGVKDADERISEEILKQISNN
jgi:UDP-N-acetylglucosamine--N-acetylmuramyl-(pentapeptide) pyrophosphoryl-undecaprenol N-acetylglucosamine transferase